MRQPITLLFLCFVCFAQAQISITGDDMPRPNDTIRLSETLMDSILRSNYLQTGENLAWNFEHLTPFRQTVKEYKRAITTPYGFFFLGFNRYGVKQFDSLGVSQFQFKDVYQYFKSDSREFRVEGIGLRFQGVPLPAYYSDEDEIYQFPLEYGDRDSSTFSFEISIPALGSYESVGYRLNKVDAWGKVTTPYGSFDCIRVMSEIVATDSIGTNDFKLGLPNVRRTYKWLTNDEAEPILAIEGNVIAGDFVVTRVRYRDVFRTIGDIGEELAPSADFVADNLTPRVTDTVRFTSNSTQLSLHEWSITPSTFSFVENTTANTRNPVVVFNEMGEYNVQLKVTNAFGEADTLKNAYIIVDEISTNKNINAIESITLFPNPTDEILQLDFTLKKDQNIQFRIFDSMGRLVLQTPRKYESRGQKDQLIDVTNLVSGVYWLEILTEEGKVYHSFMVE